MRYEVDGPFFAGVRPTEHIFIGSKAAWHEITDTLAQYETRAPGKTE